MHALIKTLRVEAAAAEAREAKEAQQAKRRVIRQELIDHLGSPGGGARRAHRGRGQDRGRGSERRQAVADAKAVLAGLGPPSQRSAPPPTAAVPTGCARRSSGRRGAARGRPPRRREGGAVLERESRDPRWEYVDRAALKDRCSTALCGCCAQSGCWTGSTPGVSLVS